MNATTTARDAYLFESARMLRDHAAELNAIRARDEARRSCNEQTTRIIRRK